MKNPKIGQDLVAQNAHHTSVLSEDNAVVLHQGDVMNAEMVVAAVTEIVEIVIVITAVVIIAGVEEAHTAATAEAGHQVKEEKRAREVSTEIN